MISREYFENYSGRKLPYRKVWREHSYFDECSDLFKEATAPKIKSICVLGTATGQILKGFHSTLGVKPHGCEISEWAYAQTPPAYKRKVRCEDMQGYLADILAKGKRFDLVFSNSFIYLPPKDLKPVLEKLSQITKYLYFRSSFRESYCPDIARTILKPYAWWDKSIQSMGFAAYKIGRQRSYCWKSVAFKKSII